MTKLLPGGFAQLLPIVQVIVGLHLEYILKRLLAVRWPPGATLPARNRRLRASSGCSRAGTWRPTRGPLKST